MKWHLLLENTVLAYARYLQPPGARYFMSTAEPKVSSLQDMPPSGGSCGTVFLIDNELLVREGVKQVIHSSTSFRVVGEACDLDSALPGIESTIPNITLLDLELPGPSGVEILLEIRRRGLSTKPVLLTRCRNDAVLSKAISAGAFGCILKCGTCDCLSEGLSCVFAGQRYFSPEITEQLHTEEGQESDENTETDPLHLDPLGALSARERQIFHLLASGLQNSVIAKRLFISPRTVETHRARIVRKLALKSNADLIRFAIRNGLSLI